jgi:peptidyl-dipeptidase A
MLRPLALRSLYLGISSLAFAVGCRTEPQSASPDLAPAPSAVESAAAAPAPSVEKKPDVAAALAFLAHADAEIRRVRVDAETKAFERDTNITPATIAAAAAAEAEAMRVMAELTQQAKAYAGVELDPRNARQMSLLRVASTLMAPQDAALRNELATLSSEMSAMYGSAKVCEKEGKSDSCRDLGQLDASIAHGKSPKEAFTAWQGWHNAFDGMRAKYARFVELANQGAREAGFADLGELWRSQYDMAPAAFEDDVERLWQQVQPLYSELHCHVRAQLEKKHGKKAMGSDGTIPAHMLGNMWGQEWHNLYKDLEPYRGQPSIDVSASLVRQKVGPTDMVKLAEGFFVSLGLDPLPPRFWERSMFEQPKDREVVCHASAWDPSYADDLRIKMCIKPDMEDLVTIHHELGHIYYFHAYYQQPMLFQSGANDGFHEGIGDTLALSVTPAYLKDRGLLSKVSDSEKAVINTQMQSALAKIAFLPFGLVIDKWRWDVFSGKIDAKDYNKSWWSLRRKYQGIAPSDERGEEHFDAGAKYHIPGNTPYMRYFLARVLQFQFHAALCQAAGHQGPLHTCSIYGSKEAGAKLQAMLAMGASQPWPEALQAIAGTKTIDAGPMIAYYEPLLAWLREQNKSRTCGWN